MTGATRYLLTTDAKGELVKVEQMGEAGDLAEVDLRWFVSQLAPPAATARARGW